MAYDSYSSSRRTYRSNKINNPAAAFSMMIDTYTKMKNEENKLKAQIMQERIKREVGFQDYIAKQQLSDKMTRQRSKDLSDYRYGQQKEMLDYRESKEPNYDPAVMDEGMVDQFLEEPGEARVDSSGKMTSPKPRHAKPIPLSVDPKRFRLGILQRAEELAGEGKRLGLTGNQKIELETLRSEMFAPKASKSTKSEGMSFEDF